MIVKVAYLIVRVAIRTEQSLARGISTFISPADSVTDYKKQGWTIYSGVQTG